MLFDLNIRSQSVSPFSFELVLFRTRSKNQNQDQKPCPNLVKGLELPVGAVILVRKTFDLKTMCTSNVLRP